MSQIADLIGDYFKTRLKTPFYSILLFWWISLHWEFIYTAFFVSGGDILDKTGLLKNEYMVLHFANWHDWRWWCLQAVKLLIALLLTVAMIWFLPKYVLFYAYKVQKDQEFEKAKIKIEHDRKVEKEKTKLVTQSVEKLEATKNQVTLEKEIEKDDPTLVWEKEFQSFVRIDVYRRFDSLIQALFTYNGKTITYSNYDGSVVFNIDRDVLAYADANELVEYDRKEDLVTPTTKGRYFIRRYQENGSLPNEPTDLSKIPF
jgi:hypothetical protein